MSLDQTIALLKQLIQTPSFSGEEDKVAGIMEQALIEQGLRVSRMENNVWVKCGNGDKPTLLLNSHLDTVQPNSGYSVDPFGAIEEDGKLMGLGSNDAGASLVSLLHAFLHFKDQELPYNLIFLASAEEENSGDNGIRSVLEHIGQPNLAIVGEPTSMKLCTAEKGLLVIDGYAKGVAGHAAHNNTVNAISSAMEDIQWINDYSFDRVSKELGKTTMQTTQINAGVQHNLVPDECHFVVDVRINDQYDNHEVFELLQENTRSELVARSFKHNSSGIDTAHALVKAAQELGLETYGSPTLSDQTALTCPSVKIGPGDSTRSHQADEYIYIHEIEEGVKTYIQLLNKFFENETLG